MQDVSESFDVERIVAETFVRSVEVHDEIGSTNDRALALAKNSEIGTPLLILAERQTGGRGRGANRWWSGPGSLTFSLVLSTSDWSLTSERSPVIALTAGLAVCETVRALLCKDSGSVIPPWMPGPPAHPSDVIVKWPNDVLIGRRKLCGILVEARAGLPRVVVGIGINVNNSLQDAPPELRGRAVSLVDVSSRPLDRGEVLIRALRQIEAGLERLRENREHLQQYWQEHCALAGCIVRIDTAAGPVVGRCIGIAEDGALLLQTERGTERILSGVVASYE